MSDSALEAALRAAEASTAPYGVHVCVSNNGKHVIQLIDGIAVRPDEELFAALAAAEAEPAAAQPPPQDETMKKPARPARRGGKRGKASGRKRRRGQSSGSADSEANEEEEEEEAVADEAHEKVNEQHGAGAAATESIPVVQSPPRPVSPLEATAAALVQDAPAPAPAALAPAATAPATAPAEPAEPAIALPSAEPVTPAAVEDAGDSEVVLMDHQDEDDDDDDDDDEEEQEAQGAVAEQAADAVADEDEDDDIVMVGKTDGSGTQGAATQEHGHAPSPSPSPSPAAAALWAKLSQLRTPSSTQSRGRGKRASQGNSGALFSSSSARRGGSSQSVWSSQRRSGVVEGFPEFHEDPEIAALKKARREAKAAAQQEAEEARRRAWEALRTPQHSGSGGSGGGGGGGGVPRWPTSTWPTPTVPGSAAATTTPGSLNTSVTDELPAADTSSSSIGDLYPKRGRRHGDIPVPASWSQFHERGAFGANGSGSGSGGSSSGSGIQLSSITGGSGGALLFSATSPLAQHHSHSSSSSSSSGAGAGIASADLPAHIARAPRPDSYGLRSWPQHLKQHTVTSYMPSAAASRAGSYILCCLTMATISKSYNNRALQLAAYIGNCTGLPVVACVIESDLDFDDTAVPATATATEAASGAGAGAAFVSLTPSPAKIVSGTAQSPSAHGLPTVPLPAAPFPLLQLRVSSAAGAAAALSNLAQDLRLQSALLNDSTSTVSDVLSPPMSVAAHAVVFEDSYLPGDAAVLDQLLKQQALARQQHQQQQQASDDTPLLRPRHTLLHCPIFIVNTVCTISLRAVRAYMPSAAAASTTTVTAAAAADARSSQAVDTLLSSVPPAIAARVRTVCSGSLADTRFVHFASALLSRLQQVRSRSSASGSGSGSGGSQPATQKLLQATHVTAALHALAAACERNAPSGSVEGGHWQVSKVLQPPATAATAATAAAAVPLSPLPTAALTARLDGSQQDVTPSEPVDVLCCVLRDWERFVIAETHRVCNSGSSSNNSSSTGGEDAEAAQPFAAVVAAKFPFLVSPAELSVWWSAGPVPSAAAVREGRTHDEVWNEALQQLMHGAHAAAAEGAGTDAQQLVLPPTVLLPYLSARLAAWYQQLHEGVAAAGGREEEQGGEEAPAPLPPALDTVLQLLLPLALQCGVTEVETVAAAARGVACVISAAHPTAAPLEPAV